MAAWICSRISAASTGSPRVVELACGAGFLAEFLQRHLPGLRYCGFDLSPHLLEFARRRLEAVSDEQGIGSTMKYHCVNLVNDDWTAHLVDMGWLGKIDAVVSIQALHDLGELPQQKQVLKQARSLLRDGGMLAYGDLLYDAQSPHSSRYKVEEHEEMLRLCGFSISVGSSAKSGLGDSGFQDYAAAVFGDFGAFACRK
ncbi:MAG: class I SAM-dependent methyltransferase [Caldilineaceae bacterium]|nr:class I SAM-dependent methyltransferase [Caldilineaceae bacterium]